MIDVIKHLQMILAQLLQGVFHSFGGAEAIEVWSLLKMNIALNASLYIRPDRPASW